MNKHVSIVHEEKNKLNIRLSDEFAKLQTKTTFQARKRYKVSESDLRSDLENTQPPKSKRKKSNEDEMIKKNAPEKIITLTKENVLEDSTDITQPKNKENFKDFLSKNKPYKCHICSKITRLQEFKKHLETHFKDDEPEIIKTKPKENTPKKQTNMDKEEALEDSTDLENTNHVSKTLYIKPYKCHICPNTYFQHEKQLKQHLEAHFTDNVHTNVKTNPKENTQWRPFGYREPKNMDNAPKKQKIVIKEEVLDVSSDLESNRSKNKRKTNEDQTSGPKNKNCTKENAPPKKQKVMIKEEPTEVSSDLENNRLKKKRKTIEDQIPNEPKNQNSTQEIAPPKTQKIVVKEKLDKTELQKLYAALLTDPQNVKKAKEDYFDKLLKNHI